MNPLSFIRQTKLGVALALLAGALLVVAIWRVREDDGAKMELPVDTMGSNSSALVGAAPRPVRQTSSEFLAARKKTHIERMLAGAAAALQERDQLVRSEFFVQLVESLSVEDVPLVLQQLTAGLKGSEFEILLLRRWAESSPREAAQWVQGLSGGPERDGLLAHIGTVWAGNDFETAFAWAESLPEAAGKQTAIYAVTEEAMRRDPPGALAVAGALTDKDARERLVIRAVSEWIAREPVEALRWVASALDESAQKPVREALVPVIASLDGASGARLVTAWLPPGEGQERAAVTAVQHWVQQSPEPAEEWVNRFPEGALRVAAQESIRRIRATADLVTEPDAVVIP